MGLKESAVCKFADQPMRRKSVGRSRTVIMASVSNKYDDPVFSVYRT